MTDTDTKPRGNRKKMTLGGTDYSPAYRVWSVMTLSSGKFRYTLFDEEADAESSYRHNVGMFEARHPEASMTTEKSRSDRFGQTMYVCRTYVYDTESGNTKTVTFGYRRMNVFSKSAEAHAVPF